MSLDKIILIYENKHSLACFFAIIVCPFFAYGNPQNLIPNVDDIHQRFLNLKDDPKLESIQQLKREITTLLAEIRNKNGKIFPEDLTTEEHLAQQIKFLKLRTLLTIINAILDASDECDLDYLQNLAALNPNYVPVIDAFVK